MRTLSIIAIAVAAIIIFSVSAFAVDEPIAVPNNDMQAIIKIDGIKDADCVKKITSSLLSVDGVKSCDISTEKSMATVVYDKNTVNDEILVQTIEKAGYKAQIGGIQAAGFNLTKPDCIQDAPKCDPKTHKCTLQKCSKSCAAKPAPAKTDTDKK